MFGYDDTAGLFDRWLAPLRGARQRQRSEWHGPQFQGHELPLDQQLDAVARRDRRLAELNRAPEPEPVGPVGAADPCHRKHLGSGPKGGCATCLLTAK
jgi:hypothetical protein